MRPDAWLAQLDLTHGERTLLANRLWALLERTVRRYTQGDSTSVPQETAEELLTSLCFTLERYRSLNGIPVRGLLDGAMEQWLERAQERLCADVEDGKRLWTRACASQRLRNRQHQRIIDHTGNLMRQEGGVVPVKETANRAQRSLHRLAFKRRQAGACARP